MATDTQPKDHILVRTIDAVLNGEADSKRLQAVVADCRVSLDTQHSEFRESMAGLAPEVRTPCESLIEGAEEVFDQFSQSFGLIEQFVQTGNRELLLSAGAMVDRLAFQMNAVQLEIRNRALSLMGPTPIPNLNLLIRAHDVYRQGQDQIGRLLELVEAEIFSGVASVANLEHSPVTPEVVILKEAFQAHTEFMKNLARAVSQDQKDKVARLMESVHVSFEDIGEKMGPAASSLRAEGETKSPQVNVVLSLTQDVAKGDRPEQALADALAILREDIKQTKIQFEAIASRPAGSALVDEEIERAREAIELQESSLKEYDEFFAQRDEIFLQAGAANLKRSADALYMCYEELQAIADREGKTLCLKCGHYNPSNRSRCEKCGGPLPAVVTDQSNTTFETAEGDPRAGQVQHGPILTPNLIRLYKAVNSIAEAEITQEAFLAELTWFEGILDDNCEYEVEEPDMEKMTEEEKATAEQTIKAIQEMEEAFRGGFQDLETGIGLFRKYIESEDKTDLEEGVKLCDQGARKLAAVQGATQKTAESEE